MQDRFSPFSRPLPILALVMAVILLDQASKIAVERLLPFESGVSVLPFLTLFRTYNTGVAFSMLADTNTWLIVAMRLAIVVFVLWLWRRTPADRLLAHPGYALIIAGAAGNLIDKFLYGHVIDFILFHTAGWYFAVFNLADSFITIGAGLVILDELLLKKKTDA